VTPCPCHDTFTVESERDHCECCSAPDEWCCRCDGDCEAGRKRIAAGLDPCDFRTPIPTERPLYEAETLGAMEEDT
jgi:hypothetical protein